jgi:small subunit ribosomal protein S16
LLKLRFKRCGRKGSPCYKIIAADSRAKRDGRTLEEFGLYNPTAGKGITFYNTDKEKRFFQRIVQGAQLTSTLSDYLRKQKFD